MMRIGFDVSQTGKLKAGCGYFADSLIQHLAAIDSRNEYVLYPTFGNHFWDNDHHKTRYIHSSNFSHCDMKHSSLEDAKQFWHLLPDNHAQKLGCVDIVHANNFFCPPAILRAKIVYTLYDLSFVENPEFTTEANRVACFDGVFNASVRADHIIAISEYSLKHFLQIFPHYPAEKTTVIYPASRYCKGVSVSNNPPKKIAHLRPNQFWLSVGTLEPRKNHKLLLQSYAKLKAQQEQVFPLVLAGSAGWMMEDFQKTLADLNLVEDVQLLGYVDEVELQWLYTHCYCMVYPSLFEGFGMPVLEAMDLGAAVITSNISSIPEIVGSAGIMINPLKAEELFEAMLKVQTDAAYHQYLKAKAIEQSKKFSWEESAQKMLMVYEKLMNE